MKIMLKGEKKEKLPQLFSCELGSFLYPSRASQAAAVVKTLPASAGCIRDAGSIPGSGRSPGGGHGNPLQCSCLENPTDRRAWRAIDHRVAKSWSRLKRLSMHGILES